MARLSFKTDSRFFRLLAIGAVGARAVCRDLNDYGHSMVELENGSTDTKIWKDVKRKRVRIPDLVCTRCGLRVESRAKTNPDLSVSHSATDAERAWDFGMVDTDVIVFPTCQSLEEADWSIGQLRGRQSYWHNRERVRWGSYRHINYFCVGDFRQVLHSRSSTKGVTEGTETSIAWDAIFSTRQGIVEAIRESKVSVRRESDGHLYTWQNRKDLLVVVGEGDRVKENQVLACSVSPLAESLLACPGSLSSDHIPSLLSSPERTQRFAGVKLARLRAEQRFVSLVEKIARHPEEDLYVVLEGAIYLIKVCDESAQSLLGSYLASSDEQTQLEAVVALAESATDKAVDMLAGILDRDDAPFFLQSAAAWALGRIGTERAIGRLVQAFADVDQNIRQEALEAVSALGDPALDRLIDGLTGEDQDVAAGSAEVIRRQVLIPPDAIQKIVSEVKADAQRVWAVWLLGHLPRDREYVTTAIADLQDLRPEAHYAITVLWAFVESWIAQHWELNPIAGLPSGQE